MHSSLNPWKKHLPAIFLVGLGIFHLAYAVLGDKPWAKTIARRVAEGKILKPWEHATIGYWQASVIGTVLLLLAAVLVWITRNRAEDTPPSSKTAPASSRWFYPALIAVLVLSAALRLPRMTHSFWNDELHAAEMFVLGETLEKGSRYDLANSWSTALQGNPTANNHVICTVETRLMQALWKKVKSPDDSRQFSEAWLRIPAFFWGMVSVFAGALLGRRVGGWACGLAFALLLTVHPLHIRFSTEARGYASLLAGIPLVMLCMHQVTQVDSRRWMWWVGLVAAEAFTVLGSPVAATWVVGIMIPAGWWLLRSRQWRLLSLLVAANLVAAVIVLDIYLPLARQAALFMKELGKTQFPPASMGWFLDTISATICGQEWQRGYFSTSSSNVLLQAALLIGWLAMLGLGFWSIFRRGGQFQRWVAISAVVGTGILLTQNLASGSGMLSWYYCPMLPAFLLVCASGTAFQGRITSWVPGGAFILWGIGLLPSWQATVGHERQPLRSGAEFITEKFPTALPVYFGLTYRHAEPYLPQTQALKALPGRQDGIVQLQEFENQAAEEKRPLLIWFSGWQEQRVPEVWHYISTSGYVQLAKYNGIDEMFDVYVFGKPEAP